ncbi:aminotransferase class I/II-fold pyridoxal phosphate-dependent enzyme [Gryllotalpicola ginsengisoli]|uniref:aminotransferase class I/II-fold pyridoxal phosphate-dependent enzyme n=1 Tax=Gryllotalpicola ginsengisoli TaxID=444608 RepID=UPI0004841E7E|nr:aminotransferase class I/II-fold pyridoxal phosphate-dependent enzyme [Gryllotalpicola ginsengisoli]
MSTSTAGLAEHLSRFQAAYDELKAQGLKLDLTRGKPAADQLALSDALLSLPGPARFTDAAGTDLRNYGGALGLPALREIFSELLGVPVPQLLALGNSSLTLMHDVATFAMLHGVPGSERPWGREETVSFLAPVPGYDRHFAITEALGIRMIPVPMNDDGPDVDAVRAALETDPTIKGIWCVPVYSNPTGAVYSREVAEALVSLPAADDFRIFWDNAYAVHHLTDWRPEPIDILQLAADAGNPDRVFVFASTSKITYPGAGVAFFGSSPDNVAWYTRWAAFQSIGPDKINQLRHVQLLTDAAGVLAHMEQHRALIAPKFASVQEVFGRRLAPHGVGSWTDPKGGYFVTLYVTPGVARRAIQLAAEAGIAITPAGSTHPYLDDPDDAVIRIAPTFPTVDDLTLGLEGFCTALLLAEAERAAA